MKLKTAAGIAAVIVLMLFCMGVIYLSNDKNAAVLAPPPVASPSVPALASLHRELGLYDPGARPDDRYEAGARCAEAMEGVLREKDSVSMTRAGLLAGDESFDLGFHGTVHIGAVTYRLIGFGPKTLDMGTQKVLFLQSWQQGADAAGVVRLYTAPVSENVTVPLHYEIIQSGEAYYIVILDKLFTPETVVLHLTTFQYESGEWLPHPATEAFNDGTWSLEASPEALTISCGAPGAADYEGLFEDTALTLTAVGGRGEALGTLRLLLDNGTWRADDGTETASPEDYMMSGFDIRTIGDYPYIEGAIRRASGRLTGPLSKEDFLKVTALNPGITSGRGLTDIAPLAALANLTSLDLSGNQIEDLTPLSGLKQLTVLRLDANQITDISPLSGLTALTGLRLDGNQITDLSPLSGMAKLKEAWLSDNSIADLTPLAGWKSIEYLHLSNNPITDITPLAHLSTLVQVHLVGCPVTTFAPVEEVEGVEP
jgi:hypothetical protein